MAFWNFSQFFCFSVPNTVVPHGKSLLVGCKDWCFAKPTLLARLKQPCTAGRKLYFFSAHIRSDLCYNTIPDNKTHFTPYGMETSHGQWLLVDTFFQNGQILVDIFWGWILVDKKFSLGEFLNTSFDTCWTNWIHFGYICINKVSFGTFGTH